MSTLLSQIVGSNRGIPAEILMLGGGGGGGGGSSLVDGGGGGAGELFQASFVFIIPSYTYIIGVGTSGIGGPSSSTNPASNGSNGGDSTIAIQGASAAILRAKGGGGGGGPNAGGVPSAGAPGGCGGGNGSGGSGSTGVIGSTTSSNQSLFDISLLGFSQRFVGFSGSGVTLTARGGAGIGGEPTGTLAGPGLSFSITGSSVTYGTGGNGNISGSVLTNKSANTGDGGDGRNRSSIGNGGNGGSGVVIIAYPDTYPVPTSIIGTYDQPTRSGWRVYRFTAGISTVTW